MFRNINLCLVTGFIWAVSCLEVLYCVISRVYFCNLFLAVQEKKKRNLWVIFPGGRLQHNTQVSRQEVVINGLCDMSTTPFRFSGVSCVGNPGCQIIQEMWN